MKLHVTDHAVLRFIERMYGLDVEALRAELRSRAERAHEAAEAIGGGEYTIKAGDLRMRVVGQNVVTCYPSKDKA